ncbi:MAG: hypothetical protein U0903_12160 [Planctomycetales bacterium]
MIALEVTLNGKRICVAGAEDLEVLTTSITAGGKLGKKTLSAGPDETCTFSYHVGGLTGRKDPKKDVHLGWKTDITLKVGDVIRVQLVETAKADRPKSRTSAR